MTDLNNFTKKVDDLVFYLDDVEGYKFFREIDAEDIKKIEQDKELLNAYRALQFLIIPFLSAAQTEILFKNSLYLGLNIREIDLKERIIKRLLEKEVADRDDFKSELKLMLADSKEVITDIAVTEDGRKLSSVADWIKDYNINTEKIGGRDLEEAKYFYQKSYFIKLKDEEKNIFKKLFSLFSYLKTSSLSPQGFEDDLLMKTEDGKLITTSKGKVVVLYDYNEGRGADIKKVRFTPIVKIGQNEKEKKLKELEDIAEQFAVGSLERRAVEEEIRKLGS